MTEEEGNRQLMNEKKTAPQRIGEVSLPWFIALHLSLLLNSTAGIMSKMAAREQMLSVRWCFWYGCLLLITFAYALAWQQVLRHMSLTFAFTNKPVTIIWGLVWGVLIFRETVTPKMLLGSAVILVGILIGVSEGQGTEEGKTGRGAPETDGRKPVPADRQIQEVQEEHHG